MARRPTPPNQRLHRLMDEAGMSRKGLARRVLDHAANLGITGLRYDHSSVTRWLAGQRPVHPTPEIIADVLTEALVRTVTPADLGMTADPVRPDLGLDYTPSWPDSMTTAVGLWRADHDDRRFLRHTGYAADAYVGPALRWLTGPPEPPSVGSRSVGMAEVHALRDITGLFRRLDNQWGGGHTRATVVRYLITEIPPLLNGRQSERTGRALLSAVAELTHLAGWMAFDLERHGLAQRYLIQGLRQARAAGDTALGAEILNGMAQHAIYVGRPGEAVDLARTTQLAVRTIGVPALLSESLVTEARALALLNDRAHAARAVAAAERALDQAAEPEHVPPWLRYFDHAYLSAQLGHCLRDLGDLPAAEQHAHRSLRMADGYTRGRAFNLALLAAIHAEQNDLDHAGAVAVRALDAASNVKSVRAHQRLRDLRTALLPNAASSTVREFTERSRELAEAAPVYTV